MAKDRDILDILLEDHQEFRDLFAALEATPAEDREPMFSYLVQRLVGHEAAESAIVHRTVRDEVPGGRPIAQARLEEEAEAEELLKQMTEMDAGSAEFTAALARLQTDVLTHALREEQHEFPQARQHIGLNRRMEMGRRFQQLRDGGPTRPHPATPQTPEVRAAVGPMIGAIDRARDAVRGLFSS